MANVNIAQLLAAQKEIIDAVDDVGVVLIRDRFVDEDEWIELFRALNTDELAGLPQGVMILWNQVSQSRGPRICTVQQEHEFSYEFLYPFDDNRTDGRTSHEVFIERVESINNALNEAGVDFNLGIDTPGSDVQHQFLQSDGPILVRLWGTGATAVKTHYYSATFTVSCVVSQHTSVGS